MGSVDGGSVGKRAQANEQKFEERFCGCEEQGLVVGLRQFEGKRRRNLK